MVSHAINSTSAFSQNREVRPQALPIKRSQNLHLQRTVTQGKKNKQAK